MSKVNGREIVHRETVLVFDGQTAEIGFSLGTWPFKLRFSFEPDFTGPRGVKSSVNGDALVWVFQKWDETLGMAFTEPIEVATVSDGHKVAVLVHHVRTGKLNRVDFQFTLGR